jgi:putative Holliday junction resolvase
MEPALRRLGIDPGARRIGLALSEPDVSVAYPYQTLEHDGLAHAAKAIAEQIDAESVEEVVIGLPLRLDGGEGEAARRARELAAQLEDLTSARVVLWDERLSTVAAKRALSEIGIKEKKGRKKFDQSAAVLILQSYLDSQRDHQWYEVQNPAVAWYTGSGVKKGQRAVRGQKRKR